MLKSTSLHKISAEDNYPSYTKLLRCFVYYCFNKLSNSFGAVKFEAGVRVVNYKPAITKTDWHELHMKSSPARKLTDIFLQNLDWKKIQKELKLINILDVGCGAGNYAGKLIHWSGNRINRYLGIDICASDNWPRLEKTCRQVNFVAGNCINIQKYITKETNLIISLSAIEHFKEDLTFFYNLARCIRLRKQPALQIHLLPSAACLDLYGFHGVRQYHPRSLNQIIRLFKPFSTAIIYKLGGKNCNALHWSYITKPLIMKSLKLSPAGDRRESEIKDYDRMLWQAIHNDMKTDGNSPTFYALVIHSCTKSTTF